MPVTPDPDSTKAPVEAGQLRYVRTLDGDDGRNPGLYVVLGRAPDDGLERPYWRVGVLCADADLDDEAAGESVEHADDWLVEWTEPLK